MNKFESVSKNHDNFGEYAAARLEENAVLIGVAVDKDNCISVVSFAHTRAGLFMLYFPVHCKNSFNGHEFVDIWSENTDICDREEFVDYINERYEFYDASWFFTADRPNFYGPLECEAATSWLESHPEHRVPELDELRSW